MPTLDFTLSTCCGRNEWTFLGAVCAFSLIQICLWSYTIIRPLKLFAVLIHEMCHALACLLTGGSVKGIEIGLDEGGVTRYIGGWRTMIIPAGYTGGALVGAIGIVTSSNLISSYIASGLLTLGLLGALYSSTNTVIRSVIIPSIVILAGSLALSIMDVILVNQWLILFISVFICIFSIYDIFDDTIRRSLLESDAGSCAALYPCLPPRAWGILWAIVAVALFAAAIYIALIIHLYQGPGFIRIR